MLDIDVGVHEVIIEGVRIPRPAGISVDNWTKFWESAKKGTYEEGYARGYNDGERDAQDSRRGH
jgi:hypothetical protein